VGTSSTVRQDSVKQLRPDVRIVGIRGTIEERIQQVEQGLCDGIIVATAALKRLGLEGHIKDIMPWEAVALQGQLAVVGRDGDLGLRALFSSIDARRAYGRVCLVGAGPGDPRLITVKGVEALKRADCVFYDYLAHKDLLNYAVKAEKICAGKRKGGHTLPQEELSRQLRRKAVEGKDVVRLKGGDPLIFGRGAEEISYLRSYHILVDVVPGVSSATAIPTSLRVPLTARDISSSVAFISGHGKDEESSAPQPVEIPKVDTVVFLMGLTKLDIIVTSLRGAGWDDRTPVLVVSKGTCVDERVVSGTIATIGQKIREAKLGQPALIIAGRTVGLWRPSSRARGRILYTGTNPDNFRLLGDVVHWPMIRITKAVIDPCQVKAMIQNLTRYSMILLTSRFAVKYFFEFLQEQNYDLSCLKGKDFFVIGQTTARALRRRGFEPALTAPVETSEGLLEAIIGKFEVRGKSILFPRSALPNPYLHDALTGRGAQVDQWVIYENTKPEKRELPKEGVDKIFFTSPSTVRHFLLDYGAIPGDWKIFSRGPATSRCLREAGYTGETIAIAPAK
jgi:uroporphyrinogen III methyltransferase/synthase